MSCTGGIKFFEKSKCLSKDEATASATSGTGILNILDYNKVTRWISEGSDDITTETIEIFFDEVEIDRLFLINMNFKEFDIQYWDGISSYVDFANVLGLDGDLVGGISETIYAKDTAYYEFDEITTTRIRIRATKTQIVDEEKYLYNCYITSEIGTFQGYPSIPREDADQNESEFKVLSGRQNILKGNRQFETSLRFRAYPYKNDYDILETLFDIAEPFLIWLCGGKYEDADFKFQRRNWELKDVYNVQYSGNFNIHWYTVNNGTLYNTGMTGNCRLKESIA
jgi:hypothetical protein